jgi:hypothetical protein
MYSLREIYTVRYEAVNAMLLNEFLKEHRKVEEQGAITAKQQKQIEALTATVQKVSDQVALSQPVPELVPIPKLTQILTGSHVINQLPRYEELACSNSWPVIACSVGLLYELLKNDDIPVIISR